MFREFLTNNNAGPSPVSSPFMDPFLIAFSMLSTPGAVLGSTPLSMRPFTPSPEESMTSV